MEIYAPSFKENIVWIYKRIQGTILASFSQCTMQPYTIYICFYISCNIIFWYRKIFPLILIVSYVHYDEGKFVEIVWRIEIKFGLQILSVSLVSNKWYRTTCFFFSMSFTSNFNNLKFLLTTWIFEYSVLYATSHECFDWAVIVVVSRNI
jgi:hypothetical protein